MDKIFYGEDTIVKKIVSNRYQTRDLYLNYNDKLKPIVNYGNFDKKLLAKFTAFSFRWATHIAPVHKSLMLQDYSYHPEIHPQQGVYYFCKNLKTPYTEIYYGFNPEQWALGNKKRKENSVAIIAAGFEDKVVFLRKGLDLIFEVAKHLPEFSFTIIG